MIERELGNWKSFIDYTWCVNC
ncbi:protein YpfM [Escherichia coli]